MKIIHHGIHNATIIYQILCSCGCEFEFDKDDSTILCSNDYYHIIKCPDCGQIFKIIRKD